MDVNIITFGCKVNTYESEIIKEKFLEKKFNIVDDYKIADVVVVNTCSVTNNADNKSKKSIRDIKRDNPSCILVVCGCMSQNHQVDLECLGIDILIGNQDKSKIVELVLNYKMNHEKYINFSNMQDLDFEDMQIKKFTGQTRAFIKIQDGCNNYCSYCIIPYMRGNLRCKDFDKAINEAQELAKYHQEIVLTGIHTGTYNSNGKDLVDLINEMSKIENIKRIRISSIEILEITEKFLDMLKNNPKVCNHLHIPLQSGSNTILKLMNRRYLKEKFLEIVNQIRAVRPDISLTTDLIVGFPGETEELFKESKEFCKLINFSKIHVFPFSLRSNTKAEKLPNHIDNKTKKERVHEMLKLSLELEEKYYEKFINQDMEVLIEQYDGKYSIGHTSNYLKVKIAQQLENNQFYNVKITKICQNDVYGALNDCLIHS
jgi:MiaB-like protein